MPTRWGGKCGLKANKVGWEVWAKGGKCGLKASKVGWEVWAKGGKCGLKANKVGELLTVGALPFLRRPLAL